MNDLGQALACGYENGQQTLDSIERYWIGQTQESRLACSNLSAQIFFANFAGFLCGLCGLRLLFPAQSFQNLEPQRTQRNSRKTQRKTGMTYLERSPRAADAGSPYRLQNLAFGSPRTRSSSICAKDCVMFAEATWNALISSAAFGTRLAHCDCGGARLRNEISRPL